MMKNLRQYLIAVSIAIGISETVAAQSTSMTIIGLSGQNMTATCATVYVPSNSYFVYPGNIYLATNNLVAGAGSTAIGGPPAGRLHLLSANQLNPAFAAAPTDIDLNGISIIGNAGVYNPQTTRLLDQAFGAIAADGVADATVISNLNFATAHPFTGAPITGNSFVTNNNKLSIANTGTLTGFDQNRYVITNNNAGELRKQGLLIGQSFIFPIGRAAADYTPARIAVASGGPVDYRMNVRNFAESAPDENAGGYSLMPNVSRTWLLYANTAGSTANMDFVHPGTPAYEANLYDRSNSNVVRFSGAVWIQNAPNDAENEALFGTPPNYFAQQLNFPVAAAPGANTYFGKTSAVLVVPVRLGDFTAVAEGCDARIQFTTLSETNTREFRIERSLTNEAGSFKTTATLPAAGLSGGGLQYSAQDAGVNAAGAYYRLAIISNSGTVDYSAIQFVRFNCGAPISVYPNPASDAVNVLLPQNGVKYQVRMFNTKGQSVLPAIFSGSGSATFSVKHLPAGMYIVTVTDQNGVSVNSKLIKQ